MKWWQTILIIFAVVVLILLTIWLAVSMGNYQYRIYSGDTYEFGGVTYTVPKTLKIDGVAYLVKEEVALKLRTITQKTSDLCRSLGREVWASWGTLLGLIRHGTLPIPWDDDADLDTLAENREFFYSKEFGIAAKAVGLEAFKLVGSSATNATKEGSAVRLRLIGDTTPTIDIFFQERANGKVSLLTSWSGTSATYGKAVDESIIFPLKEWQGDNMSFLIPNDPDRYLRDHYGEDVMTVAYPRHPIISHYAPFVLLSVWEKI